MNPDLSPSLLQHLITLCLRLTSRVYSALNIQLLHVGQGNKPCCPQTLCSEVIILKVRVNRYTEEPTTLYWGGVGEECVEESRTRAGRCEMTSSHPESTGDGQAVDGSGNDSQIRRGRGLLVSRPIFWSPVWPQRGSRGLSPDKSERSMTGK